ncbi:protein of unknown function (plasmid) [Shinella sp. WSC3-e]|nr:hypothetical protein SHINE37_60111 [Rhizobiaceae bacterium]CAK7262177.1 protein of unknown function [Shinella sp. WSC3-e]
MRFCQQIWHKPRLCDMVTIMDSPADQPASFLVRPAVLPGWAMTRGREPDDLGAAFAAGIALKSLDDLVSTSPVWAVCWRSRQALKCAAVAVRLMGRSEDEHALRDSLLLTTIGGDPGPAGRMFSAYKRISVRKPAFSSKAVAELADLLGLAWDDRLTAAVDHADDALQSGRPAPFAAADLVSAIHAMRPDAEPLAWMLADMLIAALLKWDYAVPLLMAERYGPAFKTLGGRGRVRPSERAFARAVCLALTEATGAALRTAGEIARRAEKLRAAAPRWTPTSIGTTKSASNYHLAPSVPSNIETALDLTHNQSNWTVLLTSPFSRIYDSLCRGLMLCEVSDAWPCGTFRCGRSSSSAERSTRGLCPGCRFRGIPAGTGQGAVLYERPAGWPAALRSGDDAEGAGDPDGQQPVGRAHRIPDHRPALLHALPRARPVRPCSRRPHDLAVPGAVDQGGCDPVPVRTLRHDAVRGRLYRHVRTDRRFQPGGRAEATQHEGGEGRHQGRPHPESMGGQARQTPTQGPRRSLDGEVHQGQAAGGRHAPAG